MTVDQEEGGGRIVVGVDGSSSSHKALEWAARQAEKTFSVLEVVTSWQWPKSYGYALPLPEDFDPAAVAKEVNNTAFDLVRNDHPGVDVRSLIVEGHPGQALTDVSADAAMLVVGSRGHSELVGMLLGSVSEYCVSHGRCPVVVLR
jgi:nucleotide-binding universal stress UspA family protein